MTVQLAGSFGRIWYGDHAPTSSETDTNGIISAEDLFLNTATGIYYRCASYDPGNENLNLVWARLGILTVSELAQLSVTRNFTHLTPTLNSAAQLSSSRDALVSYALDISCTLSLSGGQTGTAFLEYAEVARFVNGNTGTLTIGLNMTQNVTGTLTGIIPAVKYRRIRTSNTTGSPTFTSRPGQEVLL